MRDKGISLNIYDANFFAVETENYPSIRETLALIHKQMFPNIDVAIDNGTKVLYDTLSLSKKVNFLIGCPVRCSEKQMLEPPIKLLI